MKECKIDGCFRNPYRRGWCSPHYRRWKEYGNPEGGTPVRARYETPEESFAARLVANGDCIEWHGSRSNGYGKIFVGGKLVPVHRYAWERSRGAIPEGMYLDHICGNKHCVHLPHLRVCTNAENSRNQHGAQSRSKTGVRNVVWTKGAYQVSVGYNYRRVYGGRFSNLEDARRRAEAMRREMFGEFSGRG